MTEPAISPSRLPAAQQGWITATEVEDDARPTPALPLSYLHFWRQECIGLIGTGCTGGQGMQLRETRGAHV